MEIVAHTLNDLPFAAKQLIESLGNKRVVAVEGEMGAGKTTFITTILKAMGIPDPDGSPTYSIVNSYRSHYFGNIHHFDVYRMASAEEAYNAGVEEIMYSGGYCFIEWASKIEELLPEDTVFVTISVNALGERVLSWEP